ncbi:MAG: pectinesterase family protein [Dysgonomonas sp.]
MLQRIKREVIILLIFIGLMPIVSIIEAQNQVYNTIVAKDGSGQYQTIQDAIDAVPDNLDSPWLIFVKNGSYDEQVYIPETKKFIHLIGQDKEKTIIHHRLNVGGAPAADATQENAKYWDYSVHNTKSNVYKNEGTVVMIKGSDFYSENISYINDFGVEFQNGPQALAMNSRADRVSFNNCIFRSFQDTWMTSTNDQDRHYVKDCWIEGAVDYLYGGGNVLVETCTFYNVRSGSVIVAPCHDKAEYGYIIRDCIIDGNNGAADGRQKLGRPWHNSPKAVYINTTMRIPIDEEGWSNMGTIPGLFAEYNSRDINGNLLDLSKRKTEYEKPDKVKGSSRASISKEEADILVYENVVPGSDNWNPRFIMNKLSAPKNLKINNKQLQWQNVSEAIGYIVSNNDKILTITKDTYCSFPSNISGAIKVCPVNKFGAIGEAALLSNK